MIEVSNNEIESKDFDWHGFRKDFNYEKLNSDVIKAFISKKTKRVIMPRTQAARSKALEANPEMKDKTCSFDYVRKYHNAMFFGTSQQNVILCNSCCIEMRKFLDNYKKDIASVKKKDLTDENAAEPFTLPLHIKLSM